MNEYKEKILAVCNKSRQNTLMETLGIEYVDVGENYLTAKMPVTPAVYQPDGVLHVFKCKRLFCKRNRNISKSRKKYFRR